MVGRTAGIETVAATPAKQMFGRAGTVRQGWYFGPSHGIEASTQYLKLMERIQWTGAFAPADAALERYARFVEALPEW